MKERNRHLRYFLFSQYLADGIRITIQIVFPSIICAMFGRLDLGLTLSLGALGVSVSDAPGPVEHKRNGMMYATLFVFLMSLLTGFLNTHVLLLGLLIAFSTFFFSMFAVFGLRAASIGTGALLVMILRMDTVVPPLQVVYDSLLILAGGVSYMVVALLFFRLTPFRPAQRSLGECIHETAKFLRIKAELYDPKTSMDEEYRKLVLQQVIVNEKQDAVRELLFKNSEILKESTITAKLLVLTFADLVDLYEHIMATWYDYTSLQERFASTGILSDVSILIKKMADELDNIGIAIQSNNSYKKKFNVIPELDAIKVKIDALTNNQSSNLVLKKILVNLRNLDERVNELMNYFLADESHRKMRSKSDYSKFVSHQQINASVFFNNFTLESSVFRHSLRMMITCVVGFAIAKLMSYGHHSYWIIMTIVIILKPGFSLTKQRNLERITGTIGGGLIGILILIFIQDHTALLALIIFFMIGTYTFQRVNYTVMVIFTTPYILILFHFLGLGFVKVAEERLLDTGIASLLAFLASYILFPHWESNQLDGYMVNVLKANTHYLQKLGEFLSGKKNSSLEYKLVRKELYVSTANLAAAFNRMLSEPKSKQRNSKQVYEFVVLNHVLSSNIASLTATMMETEPKPYPRDVLQPVKRSICILEDGLKLLDAHYEPVVAESILPMLVIEDSLSDRQMKEQLDFIYKVSADIGKVTQMMAT